MATSSGRAGVFTTTTTKGYTYTNSGVALYGHQPAISFDQGCRSCLLLSAVAQASGTHYRCLGYRARDKLHIPANTLNPEWKDQCQPSVDCGVSGWCRLPSVADWKRRSASSQPDPAGAHQTMEPDRVCPRGQLPFYLRGIARADR
jgi:hypothetical protein